MEIFKKAPDLRCCFRPTRERLIRLALCLLVILLPIALCILLPALRGENIFRAVPSWSDEGFWYMQYAAISEYGKPLGYFGYAGTHASVGTYGPWGMFPTLVIGFFCRIFGWGLHAYVWYNFLCMALAGGIFLLLTRPTNRSLVMLAASNCLLYMMIAYSLINMNEVVRYAVALVLTGWMYRLITVPETTRTVFILRVTLLPVVLVFAMCFYKILAVFIPVYLFLMLRKLPVWARSLLALAGTWISYNYLYSLNSMTCAPYISGGVSFSVPNLSLKLKLMNTWYTYLGKLQNLDIFYLLSHIEEDSDSHDMCVWFCVLLYTLTGVLIWQLHKTARKPEKKTAFSVYLLALFLLICFVGGHLVFYTTAQWTFLRGCYAAVIAVMALAALLPKEDSSLWRTAVIVSLAGLITFLTAYSSVFCTSDRFSTPEEDAAWASRKEQLEQVMVLDPDADDPWTNTAVAVGFSMEDYFILPYGLGINTEKDDTINEDARYVVIGSWYDDETKQEYLDTLSASGHEVIYDDGEVVVLENTAKTFN